MRFIQPARRLAQSHRLPEMRTAQRCNRAGAAVRVRIERSCQGRSDLLKRVPKSAEEELELLGKCTNVRVRVRVRHHKVWPEGGMRHLSGEEQRRRSCWARNMCHHCRAQRMESAAWGAQHSAEEELELLGKYYDVDVLSWRNAVYPLFRQEQPGFKEWCAPLKQERISHFRIPQGSQSLQLIVGDQGA